MSESSFSQDLSDEAVFLLYTNNVASRATRLYTRNVVQRIDLRVPGRCRVTRRKR